MSQKPISPKKLAANRRNAKKSTGPKTPDGKARSSRNAVKHGLLARSIILDDNDPDERTADFDNLLDQLITDLNPNDSLERLLVERIAVCYWRLRRAHRFEANSIRELRDGTKNPTIHLLRELTGRGTPPARRVLPSNADLDKLIRYESMIDRELNRTLTQLRRLQRHPKSPPASPPSAVRSPLPNEPTQPTPFSAQQVVRIPQTHSSSPAVPLSGVPLAACPPVLPHMSVPSPTKAHGLQFVASNARFAETRETMKPEPPGSG